MFCHQSARDISLGEMYSTTSHLPAVRKVFSVLERRSYLASGSIVYRNNYVDARDAEEIRVPVPYGHIAGIVHCNPHNKLLTITVAMFSRKAMG